MRTVENDIPEIFLELAREAFALGLAEVQLGFMYMGSDFVSPIEWALWLIKRRSNSSAREHVVLTMERSSDGDQPTAYISSEDADPFDATYWGPDEVRSWMREPLDAEDEYVISWVPVEDQALQEELLAQWDLFELGVRSGWTMKRTVNWDSYATFRKTMENNGKHLEDGLPSLQLAWSITNSFYNTEGHPDNRETGADISVGGWGVISFGEEQFYEPLRNEKGHVYASPLAKEEVEKTLGMNHPWFVRVALNDVEQEEWLHFPEALEAPELTVDPSKF